MAQVKKGFSLTHAFKFYREKYGKPKGGDYKIDNKTYRTICQDFNKALVAKALTGSGVKMPFGIGKLWIQKFKINWDKPPIDFNATKLAGETRYHLNLHSDNFCARWKWDKKNRNMTNLIYYSFKPTDTNSELASAEMRKEDGHKKFFTKLSY